MIRQSDIDAARSIMVAELVRRRIIRTPAVERAFGCVARHAFLPAPYALAIDPLATEFEETEDPRRTYADVTVALNRDRSITACVPATLAGHIERLLVEEGMRVLHVGTGSGYCTAVLAELVGDRGTVVGVEYDEDLAELSAAFLAQAAYTNVTIRQGDGAAGVPEAAPFDRILVSAGVADIPPAWIAQLADEARLVFPLCQVGPLGARLGSGLTLTVDKTGDSLWGNLSGIAFFAALRGAFTPTAEESAVLAEALQRWRALEEFLRTDLPVRIVMKSKLSHPPDPRGVPWMLETRSAMMWIEPN